MAGLFFSLVEKKKEEKIWFTDRNRLISALILIDALCVLKNNSLLFSVHADKQKASESMFAGVIWEGGVFKNPPGVLDR